MNKIKSWKGSVTAQDCADLIGLNLIGENIALDCVSQLKQIHSGSLKFAQIFDSNYVQILNQMKSSLAIVDLDYEGKLKIPHILSKDPKLHFSIIANYFFPPFL